MLRRLAPLTVTVIGSVAPGTGTVTTGIRRICALRERETDQGESRETAATAAVPKFAGGIAHKVCKADGPLRITGSRYQSLSAGVHSKLSKGGCSDQVSNVDVYVCSTRTTPRVEGRSAQLCRACANNLKANYTSCGAWLQWHPDSIGCGITAVRYRPR